MRVLYLLRGCPGAGKSTWIEDNHLEPYTICADYIRTQIQNPVLNIGGRLGITQENDGKVWDLLMKFTEDRMRRGDFTIIDATHYRRELLNKYKKLIAKYRYRVYIVDFTDIPLEEVLKRNRAREKYKIVPDDVIRKMYAVFKDDTEVSKRYKVLNREEALENIYKDMCYDYNQYNKIVMIGDIHGCYEPLKEYFNTNPINDDTAYIFLGDYLDRGIQNREVLEFLLSIYNRHNILFLEGNHERWLRLYGEDSIDKEIPKNEKDILKKYLYKSFFLEYTYDSIKSKIFLHNTMKEIEGIDKKQIREFCRRLGQMAYIEFNNKRYVISHGGIPVIPSMLYSADSYINGIGKYEDTDDLYRAWKLTQMEVRKTLNKEIVLVHGHRNVFDYPIKVEEGIYNLDNHVEFGGTLRILEITKDGEKPIEIKNTVYNKYIDRKFNNRRETKSDNNKNIDINTATNEEIIQALDNSKYIKAKDLGNGLVSYNFTREAFYRKVWNNITCKARGLFVDKNTNTVVARSYDKFFNWGEMEETKTENLYHSLEFPVYAYKKENGFLALISYDRYTDDVLILSKTSNTGDYVGYINDIYNTFPQFKRDKIKEYVKDHNCTLVFECVDNEKDPHIIRYKHKHLYLLDCIDNSFKYHKLPYDELVKLSEALDIEVKSLMFTFYNWGDLYDFIKRINGNELIRYEGWVFEDSKGYMVKQKTTYYKFWKMMRGYKERLDKLTLNDNNINNIGNIGNIGNMGNIKKVFLNEYSVQVYKLMDKLHKESQLKDKSIIDIEELYYDTVNKEYEEKKYATKTQI